MRSFIGRVLVGYLVLLGLWSLPGYKVQRCRVAKTLLAPIGTIQCKY
jgi:hypothetical protein